MDENVVLAILISTSLVAQSSRKTLTLALYSLYIFV